MPKLSDQLGRSLATRHCDRTLRLAEGALRTAGRGIITCGNGHGRRQSWLTTSCSGILGEGRERTGGLGSVVLVEEEGIQRRKR